MTDQLAHDFRALLEATAELDTTILSGWPSEAFGWPTDEEGYDIESVHHELMMQQPDLSDERCWYLAGQIVARVRRDRTDSENRQRRPVAPSPE